MHQVAIAAAGHADHGVHVVDLDRPYLVLDVAQVVGHVLLIEPHAIHPAHRGNFAATRGSDRLSFTQLATFPARNFFNTRLGRICIAFLLLLARVTAVDGNVRAGDVGRGVGGEEHDRSFQIGLVGHAAQERAGVVALDEAGVLVVEEPAGGDRY